MDLADALMRAELAGWMAVAQGGPRYYLPVYVAVAIALLAFAWILTWQERGRRAGRRRGRPPT